MRANSLSKIALFMCFAISSDSFVSVLISPVYCFLLGLTPERQKQQFQVQLTSPLCVSFLIKFPVTLPPFPPTSVVRQIIKSCIIFTWGVPKQFSPAWVMWTKIPEKTKHFEEQRQSIEWCDRLVTPARTR